MRKYNPAAYVRPMTVLTWLSQGDRVEIYGPGTNKRWVLFASDMGCVESLLAGGCRFRRGKDVI